jgi:two-component system, OmpR family, phosphate regulon response regulator PhoB
MALILLIEDDTDLVLLLEHNLRQRGHTVLTTGLGQEGLRLAQKHRPDLVLLDLMLPDVDGIDTCRAIRKSAETSEIGIVILTAKDAEADRIAGFEAGALDYVVKPFSVRELLLRVQAVLRSRRGLTRGATQHRFGSLRIDKGAHMVWVRGRSVELTPLEFKLLLALYEGRDRVHTRETLLTDVWGLTVSPTLRTVDVHVANLREKLGPAGRYIETVRGYGYRFARDEKAVNRI